MLKENLLMGGGDLPHTHIVSVGSTEGIGFGFTTSAGNLEPNTIKITYTEGSVHRIMTLKISQLYTSFAQVTGFETSTLVFHSDIQFSTINGQVAVYLARSDTKQTFGLIYPTRTQTRYSFSGELFTSNDIGKDIPIWLSTKQPPWI